MTTKKYEAKLFTSFEALKAVPADREPQTAEQAELIEGFKSYVERVAAPRAAKQPSEESELGTQ